MIQTYHYNLFLTRQKLLEAKIQKGKSISVIIPALNEASTVGMIVSCIKKTLVEEFPIVDEIVVMDGESSDSTATEALKAGAKVFSVDDSFPVVKCKGKGVALWKSQFLTSGDILIFIDSDIIDFDERFVCGLLGPLLLQDEYDFVKAFYKRPLVLGSDVYENQGGRVTEILVRPLLSALIPELAYFYQPLAGEYAVTRSLMEKLPVFSGYGVEIGLLIDIYYAYGLSRVAQVDMGKRRHRNRTVSELSRMSFSLLKIILERLQKIKHFTLDHLNNELIFADGTMFNRIESEEIELCPKSQFSEECIYGID